MDLTLATFDAISEVNMVFPFNAISEAKGSELEGTDDLWYHTGESFSVILFRPPHLVEWLPS